MSKIQSPQSIQGDFSNKKKFLSWFLIGTAVGSALIYFLDPKKGKARRVQIKDKSAKLKKESSIRAQRLMIHLRNKSEGLKAKALRAASKNEPVSDQRLEGRIRSAFGRIVRHSRPIKVSVKNGVATLSGPILTKEVNDIISCVKNVSGVKDVINKLDAHATSENIPGLQGAGPEFLH